MKPGTNRVSVWSLLAIMLVLGAPVCIKGEGKIWALVVAGFNEWRSYSAHANICHFYQVFHDHGVPDEQIVVMMYDDIAYHKRNPYPGEIINEPDGPNVYPGTPHDYTGENVNKEVFLAVLQGDKEKVFELTGYDGKVIDSGPEDHVFIHYDSHGSKGYVIMPTGDPLYATELNDALQSMYDHNRYAKVMVSIEACYAGSMFEDLLPEDIDVYALTSSNSNECSYECFFDLERQITLATYYVYEYLLMCDTEDIRDVTLQRQFQVLVDNVDTSHPSQYGDLSFTSWPVSEFMGRGTARSASDRHAPNKARGVAVPRDELEIFTLKRLLAEPLEASRHEEVMAELEKKLWLKAHTDIFFSSLVNAAAVPTADVDKVMNTHSSIKQRFAYEYAVDHLLSLCPRLRPTDNTFVLGKMNVLVNLSNSLSLRKVLGALDKVADNSLLC